ncbi:Mitochondrial ATPase complex subunit atp10 [Cystobasidiomycetes sp. EMM_F5]
MGSLQCAICSNAPAAARLLSARAGPSRLSGVQRSLHRSLRQQASSADSSTNGNSDASTSNAVDNGAKAATSTNTAGLELPKMLPRPLGVSDSPHLETKSWKERMLSQEERLRERKHLVKQASKGYFEDYNALRRTGGKAWLAPKTLIQEKASLYFPEIAGTSITSKSKEINTTDVLKGKISLVGMLSTRASEAHVQSYAARITEAMKNEPLFQFVQINCQENRLKWILVGIFISSLRRSVPPQHRDTYFVSTQNLEYLREPMGMMNKHCGYVYLVDENAKIRWAAASFAHTVAASKSDAPQASIRFDEVESLHACIQLLVQRLRESQSPKQ